MTIYVARVLTLSGIVIADPLPTTNIAFSTVLSFPSSRRLGQFSIDLIPPRGANAHYIHIYKQLDYMQRVEIYELEAVGNPVFAGYILDVGTDLASWAISGEEWLGRLGQRRTGHFQPYPFVDTYVNILQWVLDVWEYNVFDDFTTDPIGVTWTIGAGTWIVTNEQLVVTSAGTSFISTPIGLSTSQDDEYKIRIEFTPGLQGDNWTIYFSVGWPSTSQWLLTITHVAGENKTNFLLTKTGADNFYRDAGRYELPFGVVSSVEYYIYDTGASSQTCEIWLNGRQFMLLTSTARILPQNFLIRTEQANTEFDNYISFYRDPLFLPGTIDTAPTSATVVGDYEPPQDTYLDVLIFAADQLNFEWRTNPKRGLGVDTIDAAESVGVDYDQTIVFQEGVNITNLNLSAAGNKITTWFRFAGQGNDVNMALAEIFDKSAIDLYGFIENQLSNQRISTVNLARQIASNQLVKVKDGNASLTASYHNDPMLPQLRVGDEVWLKSTVPDLDQKIKIVQIDYQSGTDVIQLTFDDFPRSRSGKIGVLDNDVGIINRGKIRNGVEQIITYRNESREYDDYSSRIVYNDPGSTNPGSLADTIWHKFLGGPAHQAFGQTLHFANLPASTATFDIRATGITIWTGKGFNQTLMDIFVDDMITPYTTVDLFDSANPGLFRQIAVDIPGGTFSAQTHIVRVAKSPLANPSLDVYISLDKIVENSGLWNDIFLEGRTVRNARLSIINSNTVNPVPLRIWINGTDRTEAIGGPAFPSGFIGDQTDLDVSQFISAPGVHYIDFVYMDVYDTRIDATLAVELFV